MHVPGKTATSGVEKSSIHTALKALRQFKIPSDWSVFSDQVWGFFGLVARQCGAKFVYLARGQGAGGPKPQAYLPIRRGLREEPQRWDRVKETISQNRMPAVITASKTSCEAGPKRSLSMTAEYRIR